MGSSLGEFMNYEEFLKQKDYVMESIGEFMNYEEFLKQKDYVL